MRRRKRFRKNRKR